MRMGQFSRDVVQYGQSLSVVKPPLNDPGSYISPALLSPELNLTLSQQYDLQSRIDSLYNIMRGERSWFSGG
jgi:hypothetical protein